MNYIAVNSKQKNQLAELPADVKRRLFSFLSPRDAAQFLLVCKSLQQAALDDTVWENFARSRWKSPHEAVFQSWQSLYVSGNGWTSCALKPENINAFPQGRHLRWKFEHDAAASKGKFSRELPMKCTCNKLLVLQSTHLQSV
jgi:F-box domain